MFRRRLPGMIINAPGCQHEPPQIIKKDQNKLLGWFVEEQEMFCHFLLCSDASCYTATSHYSPSLRAPVSKSSREEQHVDILVRLRRLLLFSYAAEFMWCSCKDTIAQTCANHVVVRYTIIRHYLIDSHGGNWVTAAAKNRELKKMNGKAVEDINIYKPL